MADIPICLSIEKVKSEASMRLIVALPTCKSEALKFAAVLWLVAGVNAEMPLAKKSEADVLAETARVEACAPIAEDEAFCAFDANDAFADEVPLAEVRWAKGCVPLDTIEPFDDDVPRLESPEVEYG